MVILSWSTQWGSVDDGEGESGFGTKPRLISPEEKRVERSAVERSVGLTFLLEPG